MEIGKTTCGFLVPACLFSTHSPSDTCASMHLKGQTTSIICFLLESMKSVYICMGYLAHSKFCCLERRKHHSYAPLNKIFKLSGSHQPNGKTKMFFLLQPQCHNKLITWSVQPLLNKGYKRYPANTNINKITVDL